MNFLQGTNDMSNRLKSTILWTIYIAMVLVGGFTIILIGIGIVTPIFSLKINTSGIEEYLNTFGMVLSCLSVGLGVYSIKQANGSEKQTNEILRSIQAVEREQNLSKSLLIVESVTLRSEDKTNNFIGSILESKVLIIIDCLSLGVYSLLSAV